MILSAIVAIDNNNAIGKDNALLWHLPADLKFFKQTTNGHTVIMGRKTYESIGRPLPNRRNIVITTQNIKIMGCEVANSIDAAIALCGNETEVFVVGGGKIYTQMMDVYNKIYITRVNTSVNGADTFFPELNTEKWTLKTSSHHPIDDKNNLEMNFELWEKKD